MKSFRGKPRHEAAGIAEDEFGRSAIRPVIPSLHAGEDLFDFGLGRLIPVEKADFVFAWNRRQIERE